MSVSKKIAFVKNALCLLLYALVDEPHRMGAALACSVKNALGFAFDSDRFDRSAEKRAYKDCMMKEFNRGMNEDENTNVR